MFVVQLRRVVIYLFIIHSARRTNLKPLPDYLFFLRNINMFTTAYNRLSVLGAITSTQQKLKLYTRVPDNGLVLYCGTILTDDGKEKRVNIDFEPFKPINTSLYLCDNKFHTEVRVGRSLPLLPALLPLPLASSCS